MEAKKNRKIRAPRGEQISCKGWIQEAAMRMLMNNLDPNVAEKPNVSFMEGQGKLPETGNVLKLL